MTIYIGDVPLVRVTERHERLTCLLWGGAGCGKSTLATTAPLPMIYLAFDANAISAIPRNEEIWTSDYTKREDSCVVNFLNPTNKAMVDLVKSIKDLGVKTVVFDSTTTFGDKALRYGVVRVNDRTKSTIEAPGWAGYGMKATYVRNALSTLLEVTGRAECHFIALGHEDVPKEREVGNNKKEVVHQTILLGSSLSVEVPKDMAEVWHLTRTDFGGVTIRLCPRFPLKPIVTRMFNTDKVQEFAWKFNPRTREGEGLSHWYSTWEAAGFDKIEPPGSGRK